ncbi:hypothetical protein MQE36_14030 [Zhouia spongiae]|uniref:Uncharacterized protein n=1 Tax=Zhouia spongiae TaxID=2202721 RepID=A0ABY3YL26_9FLAO|nr:hypothetical protein [Zhouia spongiae]UNY98196.1 hypothetical protein MQE36_14030 [Zhouia spongiae]
MKHLILFIAITTLFKPLWPVVDYVINYEYISEVLCENKDRPELHCDGKCYLSKMLAQESNKNDKNPFEGKQLKTEILQIVYFENFSFKNTFAINQIQEPIFGQDEDISSNLFTFTIPHPPNS